MDGPDRISVFLADDNVIVREGVKALLGLEADLEIVGTAADQGVCPPACGVAAPPGGGTPPTLWRAAPTG